MFYYNQYVRAQSLDEAYELYQKKPNFVLGGMLWLKMKNKTLGTAIDLCDLGLDQIDEDENEFRIGAYATLRQIETHEALNAYTHGAIAESVRHIVGVQFRNVATVGGSIWGRFGFSDVMTIFRALGAKVQLHKAGIMDLDEFAALPRTTRDVLVSVIVPKNAKGVVYLSQRNQSTDFPVLTCAVANRSGRYVAVIGASPYMAEPVWDEEGILDCLADAKTDGNAALTENSETNAKIDKFAGYVAEHIRFGSNIRAGAEYREMICRVLTRRAVTQSLDICDEIKHEH
jgi:CO/xanthine dehydrogenase FAD-binding subunit